MPGTEPALRPRHATRKLFVGGLHRSGTSILAEALRANPHISAHLIPEMPEELENEGQHFQTVFPVDDALGGPGYFAHNALAHMTEHHELVADPSTRARLEQVRVRARPRARRPCAPPLPLRLPRRPLRVCPQQRLRGRRPHVSPPLPPQPKPPL